MVTNIHNEDERIVNNIDDADNKEEKKEKKRMNGDNSEKLSTMALRLKQLRKQRDQEDFNNKWTQQFVASQLGISRSAYALYETGENQPSIDVLIKLCDLYGGVSLDYIMGLKDEVSVDTAIVINPNMQKIINLVHRLPDDKREKFMYMLYGILLNEGMDD